MRVIAGKARRLNLKTIPGNDTRPTTDRIKETLFNILQPEIPGCRFLDLFSGSGAIGIEALSRGAEYAVFVEKNPKACTCIRENLSFTKLAENGKVIIKGEFAPIIGRICMDQFMIDVTNIPDVKIGDEVILLGEKNGLKYNADDIAEKLGTINYEVTCMLKSRLPRVYIKNKHIINVKNHI